MSSFEVFEITEDFLYKNIFTLWHQEVLVRIKTHPYSKKAHINVSPADCTGIPGIDYPILKLSMDLKQQAIELRVLEQTGIGYSVEATYLVLAELAHHLGNWQIIEKYAG